MKKNLIFVLCCLLAGSLSAQDFIHLCTPNTSLVLSAPENGKLRYVYYGSKLTDTDVEALAGTSIAVAYPEYGSSCPAEAALAVTQADGNMSLQLKVDGVAVTDSDKAEEVVIRLSDTVYPFSVAVCYRAFHDVDIIECWTELTNCGKKAKKKI